MASKTTIANQALAKIGAKTIMDLDDTTSTSARVVKNVFEESLRQLGRMHDWNCLMARESLAQLSEAPAFGFDYQYQLPTQCLKLCTINGYELSDVEDRAKVEGRRILSDSDEMKITYVKYTENTGEFDPLFNEALATLIASKIATSIRQDEGLALKMTEQFYQVALPAARKKDGNEGRRRRIDIANDSDWIRSRVTSTTG